VELVEGLGLVLIGFFFIGVLVVIGLGFTKQLEILPQIGVAKIAAEEAFRQIEVQLNHDISAYRFLSYRWQGFWAEAEYAKVKEQALNSFVYKDKKNGIEHPTMGSRVEYRIDKEKKLTYINIAYQYDSPKNTDWDNRMLFDEWSTKETNVDRAIADYKSKRKRERQGKPKPRWWEFWLID